MLEFWVPISFWGSFSSFPHPRLHSDILGHRNPTTASYSGDLQLDNIHVFVSRSCHHWLPYSTSSFEAGLVFGKGLPCKEVLGVMVNLPSLHLAPPFELFLPRAWTSCRRWHFCIYKPLWVRGRRSGVLASSAKKGVEMEFKERPYAQERGKSEIV